MSLNVDGLTYRFGDRVAIHQVSFSVPPGQIVGLFGSNGAGKSTLMRALCGLLAPAAGTVEIAGFDLARDAAPARAHIGYVAQPFGLYDDLSVSENLNFYGRAYGLATSLAATRAADSLLRFGLDSRKHDRTGSLSHGWRQRVAVASALLHHPRVLLLDEASAGLDADARRHLWIVLEEEADRGAAILISTHSLDEVQHCTRVLRLEQGQLI